MHLLSAETAETVTLAVLREDHVRIIESLESPHHIRLSNPVPHRSSVCVVAGQGHYRLAVAGSHATADSGLRIYQITENPNTDPVSIRKDLARIRERGYSHEKEESVRGGCCVGAPIFSDNNAVRAAISVAMPLIRHTAESDKRVPALLLAATKRISERLGEKVPAAA